MKKRKLLKTCLSTAAIFSLIGGLTSCNQTQSDSSDISSDVPSSDTSSDSGSSAVTPSHQWSEAAKTLMMKYCGTVLPSPAGLFSDKTIVREAYSTSYGGKYLEIVDEADTFTLINYYADLEEFGWNVIKGYNNNPVKKDSDNIQFVECTRASSDASTGYDLRYFWSADGDTPCNYIRCYNDLNASKSKRTNWTDDESATIKDVIASNLPWLEICSDPIVSKAALNSLYIVDYYYADLSGVYSVLLKTAGFEIDETISQSFDAYYLKKTLAGGATIQALLSYNSGNIFYFEYTPKMTSHDSWPTDIINEIKEKSGVEIPKFNIADGGTYETYVKNDVYYFYTDDIDSSYDYEMYVYDEATFFGLTWDETLYLHPYMILDDNQEYLVGFMLSAEVVSPSSTFVDSWPTDVVNDTVSNVLKIDGITMPVLDSSYLNYPEKKVKYQVYGEDYYKERYAYYYDAIVSDPESYGLPSAIDGLVKPLAESLAYKEEGILISIYDGNLKAATAYGQALYNLAWYETTDDDLNTVWEDPTGTIAVTFTGDALPTHDNDGETTIFIHPGSGEAHTPSIEFTASEKVVGIGIENQLTINKSMLPYDVTYTSSDASGKIAVSDKGVVTVASDVVEGTTATITASCTVPGTGETYTATCVVTAQKVNYYTPASALQAIAAVIESKGYTATITEAKKEDGIWVSFDTLKANFGTDYNAETLKTLVQSELIPEGFEVSGEDGWVESEISATKTKTVSGWTITYRIMNDFCIMALEVRVYVYNGNAVLEVEAY